MKNLILSAIIALSFCSVTQAMDLESIKSAVDQKLADKSVCAVSAALPALYLAYLTLKQVPSNAQNLSERLPRQLLYGSIGVASLYAAYKLYSNVSR